MRHSETVPWLQSGSWPKILSLPSEACARLPTLLNLMTGLPSASASGAGASESRKPPFTSPSR
jgi:hypothetical protein